METTEIIEYGVRYLNGEEDWDTRRWFGHIESPDMRASFTEQYDLRMAGFGAPKMPLVFLTRTKTITYSEPVEVDDTAPEPTPEPAPEPGPGPVEGVDPEPVPEAEPVPGEELSPEPVPDPVPADEEEPSPELPAEGNDTTKEGAEHGAE